MDILNNYNVDVKASLDFWGDIESYNDGLKEFLDSLDEKLTNLLFYKNNQDYPNYGILAHSIKSEAKYLGFMNDAEIFLKHEMAGKESNATYINDNFKEIEDTINRIKDLLTNYFNDDTSTKIILIADDSSIMQNFIEKYIHNTYQILKASDGKETINALENNNNIYALLLDLNMPNVNGFEVLDYLKDNGLFASIPVVIITGDDTEDTIKKAFTYPIIDVLNKPFNDVNINRVLESIKNFYEK